MIRSLWSAVVVLPAILASAAVGAQPIADHPHYWSGGWGWGHMAFGGLMMLLFWAGLIAVVVLAVRWLGGAGHGPTGGKTARHILDERFAGGEIDKDEYEERKGSLSN